MDGLNSVVASQSDLWFLPLGGCGEIGMNMNLYGHDGQWLMVDCGVCFKAQEPDKPGTTTEVYSADPSFIAQDHNKLAGIVITHAHEDHVGALADLWPRLKAPIYTTAFTAEVLRRKLATVQLDGVAPIHIVATDAIQQIGVFNVEWLQLTHSIPEPQALIIRTPAGNIFHTADWKLDAKPIIGKPYNKNKLQRLASENINALVCDSTNADCPGWSTSEGELVAGLYESIKHASGRVAVACFGSNVARLITLAQIAERTERHFGVIGRSLQNMISVAKHTGYWPDELKVIDSSHLGYLPENEVLAVVTGSQGEPKTALSRLANDDHFAMDLTRNDTVIFSSRVIPGNEHAVEVLIQKLNKKGIKTIEADQSKQPIHASGHPHTEELSAMYQWVQPQLAIPVHGEAKHMQANATLAKQAHVPRQLVGTNGDLFQISPQIKRIKSAVKTGQLKLKR